MSFAARSIEWLRLYVIVLVSTSLLIVLGTFIYTTWMHVSFNETMPWTLLVSALILLSMGAISLIPLSEYAYMRQGARNPEIIRAGMEDMRREKEGAPKLGVILVLVGFTLILLYLLMFGQ